MVAGIPLGEDTTLYILPTSWLHKLSRRCSYQYVNKLAGLSPWNRMTRIITMDHVLPSSRSISQSTTGLMGAPIVNCTQGILAENELHRDRLVYRLETELDEAAFSRDETLSGIFIDRTRLSALIH